MNARHGDILIANRDKWQQFDPNADPNQAVNSTFQGVNQFGGTNYGNQAGATKLGQGTQTEMTGEMQDMNEGNTNDRISGELGERGPDAVFGDEFDEQQQIAQDQANKQAEDNKRIDAAQDAQAEMQAEQSSGPSPSP